MESGKKRRFSRFVAATLAVVGLSGSAPAKPVSENMELMDAIAREIVNSGKLQNIDWVEVSAILAMDAEGDVAGSYGYDAKGKAHAAAFLTDPIEREVKRYREWLCHKGGKGIIKMVFQFTRNTLRVNADFEHDDPLRWQVTPKNIDTITEDLRPRLKSADDQPRGD